MTEVLRIKEGAPKLRRRPTLDVVLENNNNATVCLGLDRPPKNNRYEEFAPIDDAKIGTATVDIVVGRETRDPNYNRDAARILISSKTNGDTNFGLSGGFLTEEQELENKDGNSFAVTKADSIRLIAREDVRIQSQDSGASVTLKTNGDIIIHTPEKVLVGSKGADEPIVLGVVFVDLMKGLLTEIMKITVANGAGVTSPPRNIASFQNLLNSPILDKKILSDMFFAQKESGDKK